jgi:hypothetical protein
MSKRIQTYQDLLDEKQRLESVLKLQKENLRQDIEELKESIAPFRKIGTFVSKLFTRKDNSFVVDAGISTLVTFGVKRLLLARAGWLTRLIIPFIIKNLSSHVVADNKDSIMKKLFSWIGKKNANGHMKEHPK